MDWRCGSRVPALCVWSPEFKIQSQQKIKIIMWHSGKLQRQSKINVCCAFKRKDGDWDKWGNTVVSQHSETVLCDIVTLDIWHSIFVKSHNMLPHWDGTLMWLWSSVNNTTSILVHQYSICTTLLQDVTRKTGGAGNIWKLYTFCSFFYKPKITVISKIYF
jgi:hypothetical protein